MPGNPSLKHHHTLLPKHTLCLLFYCLFQSFQGSIHKSEAAPTKLSKHLYNGISTCSQTPVVSPMMQQIPGG
jgi:hypothetical protein